MRYQVLCSTGAFIGSVNGRNHRLIIENAPELRCDGFEFLMYAAFYDKIDLITKDLSGSGLEFPVLHVEKQVGELISRNESDDTEQAFELFKKNCRMANGLDAKKMVLHLWGGYPSDKNIGYNIKQYYKLNQIAKEHGLLLTVENVVCNNQNPMTHLKILRNTYTDIAFTFDTKMAAFHGELELLYKDEWDWLFLENRIRHFHVNDYGSRHMDWDNLKALHIGEGNIDFEKFFQFIQEKNYSGTITVEGTSTNRDGSINIEKLNHSLQYINEKNI